MKKVLKALAQVTSKDQEGLDGVYARVDAHGQLTVFATDRYVGLYHQSEMKYIGDDCWRFIPNDVLKKIGTGVVTLEPNQNYGMNLYFVHKGESIQYELDFPDGTQTSVDRIFSHVSRDKEIRSKNPALAGITFTTAVLEPVLKAAKAWGKDSFIQYAFDEDARRPVAVHIMEKWGDNQLKGVMMPRRP